MILSITSITVRADDNVIYLEKNKPAPYSGYLFTELYTKEIRKDLLEADKLRLTVHSQSLHASSMEQIIKLKDREIDLYRVQNDRLIRSQQTSESMRYIWFGLGVLATGAAVYGAGALSR